METAVILVALTVMITTNLMIFHALRRLRPNEVELFATLETFSDTPVPVQEVPATPLPGQQVPETPVPAPVLVPQAKEAHGEDESYHAWKNRTEQPISAPPSPHGPPPKPGPLERPYGFSR